MLRGLLTLFSSLIDCDQVPEDLSRGNGRGPIRPGMLNELKGLENTVMLNFMGHIQHGSLLTATR